METDQNDYEGLAQELMRAVGRINRTITPMMRNATRGEMAVAFALHNSAEPLAPSDIAGITRMSTARVANVLAALEKKGWVAREHSVEDRRRVAVSMTEQGNQEFDRRHAEGVASIAAFLSELGADDAREMVRIAQKCGAVVEKNKGKGKGCRPCA